VKIAISATGLSLDSPLGERFERCSRFVIADLGGAIHDPVVIRHRNLDPEITIRVSRMLVERGISVVLMGRCDPKTLDHLASAGLWVVTGCRGIVRQVLEKFMADLNGPFEVNTESPPPPGRAVVDSARRSGIRVGGGRGTRRRRERGLGEGFGSGGKGDWPVGGFGGI